MSQLRFGLYVPNQHPRDCDMRQALGDQVEFIGAAGGLGWDSIWTGQHFLTPETSQLSTIVTLSRLAAEAGTMTMGVGLLLLPLLNPVETAEHIASLEVVTGGRLVVGVGIGYRDSEYRAFGISKTEAVRRFTGNLEVITKLLTGKPVDANLPWCQLDSACLSVEPTQLPPIWMGANADGAVRRAARLVDAWLINPHATLSTVTRQVSMYDGERAANGLPFAQVRPVLREVVCAPTSSEAQEIARRFLGEKYQTYSKWGQDEVLADNDSFDSRFVDLADGRFVVGTPDDCLQVLRQWRSSIGADYFVFRVHWSGMPKELAARSVRLLTREVLPALREE